MKSQEIKKQIAKLPNACGVYIFRKKNKILYIGKATSLRDRVRSYFSSDVALTRSPLISKMLTQFDAIEHIKTDSVLEALVLEANLIKKYQPEANIKEKDNRSFNFVVITKEDFPRVLIMRGRELLKIENLKLKITKQFGPFPNGSQLKEAMKIVRKMFPYRDKCIPFSELKSLKVRPLQSNFLRSDLGFGKPCFNRQIGLCPGVCTGEISKEEYAKQIDNIILFFEGNKKRVMKNLEKQMQSYSKNRQFEKANITKHTLFTLNHIQDISLIKEESKGLTLRLGSQGQTLNSEFRIESYDIAHLSGTNVVGVMTVVEDGEVKRSDYRKFSARGGSAFGGKTVLGNNKPNDTKALREVLSRRLGHIEWRMPDLIVVDGGVAQKRVMEKVLKENHLSIPVVSVVKNEHHKPKEILGERQWLKYEREILLSNSEAHRFAINFHKQLRGKI